MFDNRPVPGFSGYRTPVDNLYLCGAGTWPGGAVFGAPGRNCARQVLADLEAAPKSPADAPRPGTVFARIFSWYRGIPGRVNSRLVALPRDRAPKP